MNNKYAIINIETIQKRIEELEEQFLEFKEEHYYDILLQERDALKTILSQSTPLIPVIEKAIQYGVNLEAGNVVTDYKKFKSSEEQYINNLKLDI